jgi:hypothetical protein
MLIFYWTRFGVDFRASFFIGFIQAGNFLILAKNPEFMETCQCCIHSGACALCRVHRLTTTKTAYNTTGVAALWPTLPNALHQIWCISILYLFTLPAKSPFLVQFFTHPFKLWIHRTHPLEIFVLHQFR